MSGEGAPLAGVHPLLIERIRRVLEAMRVLGFPMVPTSGLRTDAQQWALWLKGRDATGTKIVNAKRVVTHADGQDKRSNHQARADGYGHAVDCAFVGLDGKPSWAESHPWGLYGTCVRATGLAWGGDWRSFPDRPHAELKAADVVKIA